MFKENQYVRIYNLADDYQKSHNNTVGIIKTLPKLGYNFASIRCFDNQNLWFTLNEFRSLTKIEELLYA